MCAAVEQRAQQVRESVKDPAELEDRVGVDLTASTTAARAKSMWVIKQEKIARARCGRAAAGRAGRGVTQPPGRRGLAGVDSGSCRSRGAPLLSAAFVCKPVPSPEPVAV